MMETTEQPIARPKREFTPAELATVDAGYWAYLRQIELQHGNFSFRGHEYQKGPMSHHGRRKCIIKATQGGFTEAEVLVSLHGLIHGRLPLGCLYLFPTADDVGEFSKSRFGPLISANHKAIGKYVRDTDSTTLKKVGSSFLFLRGARLTQSFDGEAKESSKLRSISVDRTVFDEYDLMDELAVEKARGRMGHSEVQEEVFISNPTLDDVGIDKVFKTSDRKHWFRRCAQCGKEPPAGADWEWYSQPDHGWTCAEVSFPGCVRMYREITDRRRGYIACGHCGSPVGITPGDWVPQCRENSEFMAGFRWSQLTSLYHDPADILDAYTNPPEGNLGDVVRLRLGRAHTDATDRLQESQVLGCCGRDFPAAGHPGPCAMGVDIGKLRHVVIGIRTGNDQYELLRTTTASSFQDIHELAQRFNVKSAVIDLRPYEDEARSFQKSESYPIYLAEYSDTMASGPQYDPNKGLVKVNRTEICDRSHRVVTTEGMLKIPCLCPETKLFARQLCGMARVVDKDKRTGTFVARYRPIGEAGDHFRHALNYFLLAASGGKIARADGAAQNRPRRAINNFRVGVRR